MLCILFIFFLNFIMLWGRGVWIGIVYTTKIYMCVCMCVCVRACMYKIIASSPNHVSDYYIVCKVYYKHTCIQISEYMCILFFDEIKYVPVWSSNNDSQYFFFFSDEIESPDLENEEFTEEVCFYIFRLSELYWSPVVRHLSSSCLSLCL